ncbi:hypothetical protein [Sorangium sp. So ce341]|uniref:hypothetical protein n=1 Tax=Sorangium sp. So ce341 TaxID=3133302 RepID=UPI003F63F661
MQPDGLGAPSAPSASAALSTRSHARTRRPAAQRREGSAGIHCALSTGGAFGPVSLWVANYHDAAGWKTDPSYWSTIRFPDVNGVGRSDVCGRGAAGLYCAVSDGARFGEVQRSTFQGFADSDGVKDAPSYYETITFLDLNHDGRSDVCRRAGGGIHCGRLLD